MATNLSSAACLSIRRVKYALLMIIRTAPGERS
jgi:hypothetical protein